MSRAGEPSATQPAPGAVVNEIRRRLGTSIRDLLAGGRSADETSRDSSDSDEVRGTAATDFDMGVFESPAGDPGLFGPESVAWRVHSDAAMLIGGLRALLMQTLHPLAMAGVADHSNYRTDPWGRLNRTANYVTTTTFGSTEAAMASIATVKAVHRRVKGTAADGRAYSAQDPKLITWVHVTEVDSFLRCVRAFGVDAIDDAAADVYVGEMAELGRLMGGTDVPSSLAEVEAFYRDVRGELSVDRRARSAVRFLLWPPVPQRIRPAYGVMSAAAISTMPEWTREALWLPVTPKLDRVAVAPAGELVTSMLRWALGDSPVVDAASRRAASGLP